VCIIDVCEIPVCIIDTPGLGAMDLSSKEEDLVLASVSVLTDKDLLCYCMSLVGRFDNKGEHIAKQLTTVFWFGNMPYFWLSYVISQVFSGLLLFFFFFVSRIYHINCNVG